MRSFFLFAVSLVAVAGALAACGDDSSSGGGAGTDGGGGGGGDDATVLDDAAPSDDGGLDSGLYPRGTTKIVFTSKGGLPFRGPDGSVCEVTDITYTVVLPSRDLSWKVCEMDPDGGPFAYRTGQKTLTAEQFAGVETTLRALKRATMVKCGADKPLEEITFTTPSGDVTYLDDFYFCDANDPKIYVSGLEDVFTALTILAQ